MTGERCIRCQAARVEHGIPTLGTCPRFVTPGSIWAWLWRRRQEAK